jgi:hypothetical protein
MVILIVYIIYLLSLITRVFVVHVCCLFISNSFRFVLYCIDALQLICTLHIHRI